MSLDTARIPLLGNIQQNSYGSALDATAEERSYVIEVKAGTKEAKIDQPCAIVITPESGLVFKTWAIFRRMSEFLHQDDLPSMLSVVASRPEEYNVALIRKSMVDNYLREQIPKQDREAIYKLIENTVISSRSERDHVLSIMEKYFPNLSNLSREEESELWLQICENSQTLNGDMDGTATHQAISDLHTNIVLMRRLCQALTRWSSSKSYTKSLLHEMWRLFENLKQNSDSSGDSSLRVMAALAKTGKWDTAPLFDRMKREKDDLCNWTLMNQESFNLRREFHILRCAVMFDRMIKAIQEKPYISENTRPRLIEVVPGEEPRSFRCLLQNPSLDRVLWSPWEFSELRSSVSRTDKNGLTNIFTKNGKHFVLLNLPGNNNEEQTTMPLSDFIASYRKYITREFMQFYNGLDDRIKGAAVFALSALGFFPMCSFIALQKALPMPDPTPAPPHISPLPLNATTLVNMACGQIDIWPFDPPPVFCSASPSIIEYETLPYYPFSQSEKCNNFANAVLSGAWGSIADLQKNLFSLASKCIESVEPYFNATTTAVPEVIEAEIAHQKQIYLFLKYGAPILLAIAATVLFFIYRCGKKCCSK